MPLVAFPRHLFLKPLGDPAIGSCRVLVNIPLSKFGSKVISLSNMECNIDTNVRRSSLLCTFPFLLWAARKQCTTHSHLRKELARHFSVPQLQHVCWILMHSAIGGPGASVPIGIELGRDSAVCSFHITKKEEFELLDGSSSGLAS